MDPIETRGRHDSRWDRRDVDFRALERPLALQPSSTPFIEKLAVVCSMHGPANLVVCCADCPVRTRLRSLS